MCPYLVFELAFALHRPPGQYIISVLYTRRLEASLIFISEMRAFSDTVGTFNFWTSQSTNNMDWQCKLWPTNQISQDWKHLHHPFVNRQNPNKPTGVLILCCQGKELSVGFRLRRRTDFGWESLLHHPVLVWPNTSWQLGSGSGFEGSSWPLPSLTSVFLWGKDRTGLLACLLLSALGMDKDPPQRLFWGEEVVSESLRRATVLLKCGIAPPASCLGRMICVFFNGLRHLAIDVDHVFV